MAIQSESPNLRNNNFDVLRLFFAACVVVTHAYVLLLGQHVNALGQHIVAPVPLQNLFHNQTDLGSIAVDAFFIISGFLVTSSFERSRTALDYLRKRALRIFPGLTAAVFVCIFVVAPLGGAAFPQYLLHPGTWKILSILLMRHVIYNDLIPGVFTKLPFSPDLIGTAWTLQFEFACYLIVMVLGILGTFRNPRLAVGIIGGLFLLSLGVYHHWNNTLPVIVPWFGYIGEAPRFVVYFLAGSLAYLLRDRIPHSRVIALVCVGLIALCHSRFLNDVLPIAGTYLLLYAAFSRSVKLHPFGGKVDLSYGVYLYGWPVEQLLVYYFGPHLTPLSLMTIAMPITAALAWASWTLVEQPCLRLKQRKVRADLPSSKAVHFPEPRAEMETTPTST